MPQVPVYRSPYGDSIAALLARQGDIAAQGAERSGQIWSQGIGQLGQIAGQAVEQYGQQKAGQKQAASLDAFVASDLWVKDPKAGLAESIRILGPEKGVQFFEGLQGVLKVKEAPTPAEARAGLPMLARGFSAAPAGSKPKLWAGLDQLFKAAKLLPEEESLGEYNPEEHDPIIASFAAEGAPKAEDGFELSPGQTRFGPDGKPIASLPAAPVAPKAQSLDQMYAAAFEAGDQEAMAKIRQAQAAAAAATRAPKEAGGEGTWTEAEGPDGKPILFNSKTGEAKPYPAGVGPKPAAMEQNRRSAARNSIVSGESIMAKLGTNEYKEKLGPLTGRYKNLMQALGAGDPVAVELVGDLKSFSALQPAVHGFRAVQMAKDVEKLLTTKQTAASLAAGLKGILSASYIVAKEKPSDEEGQVKMPGGWIREIK